MDTPLLEIIDRCDNSPYDSTPDNVYQFLTHDNMLIGHIPSHSVEKFHNGSSKWLEWLRVDSERKTVTVAAYESCEDLTRKFKELVDSWRAAKIFDVLEGWRDELYTCYGASGRKYFQIERSAACIFGLVTYGVHITGYTYKDKSMYIWVPRRSYSKPTYPGMLDNTVAGGLGNSLGFADTATKECQEEAGLEEEFTKSALRQTGVVTYEHIDPKTNFWQPEVEVVYDMELPAGLTPHPVDGEVAEFQCMSIPEVSAAMRRGEFKYNCALVLIDFFIRHGVITSEAKNYMEVAQRCHRRLEYPLINGL